MSSATERSAHSDPRPTKSRSDTGRMARTRKASQRRRRPGKGVRPRTAGRREVRPTEEEYSVIEEGADPKRGKSGHGRDVPWVRNLRQSSLPWIHDRPKYPLTTHSP